MNSQVYDKAYQFAIRIVNAYKYLYKEKKEFVLELIRKVNIKKLIFGSLNELMNRKSWRC